MDFLDVLHKKFNFVRVQKAEQDWTDKGNHNFNQGVVVCFLRLAIRGILGSRCCLGQKESPHCLQCEELSASVDQDAQAKVGRCKS